MTLDVRIQGREYRVACAAEEVGYLQAAAELLDARIGDIAKATNATGERLAVMTALNLAHELNAAQRAASAENPVDAGDVRCRIKAIEARLDAVLAWQDDIS